MLHARFVTLHIKPDFLKIDRCARLEKGPDVFENHRRWGAFMWDSLENKVQDDEMING
jgi:hypothetical protein